MKTNKATELYEELNNESYNSILEKIKKDFNNCKEYSEIKFTDLTTYNYNRLINDG